MIAIRRKKVNWIRVLFLLCCTVIPLVHFCIFYIFVNINSFMMAFQQYEKGEMFWTIGNFTRFFEELANADSELIEAIRNTFITFFINQIMFGLSILVSYFLYKKVFMYNVFRLCFFLPTLIAGTIVNSVFTQIVGVSGPIAPIVQDMLGLEFIPTLLRDDRFANGVVFANLIWLTFPGNMIILGGTFSRVPVSVLESGRLDGLNWFQEAVKVIIPVTWPTISLLWILSIVGVFGASGNVFLLTKGEFGTQTLSNWMYMQVYNSAGSNGESNALNYLSAVGMFFTFLSMILFVVIRYFTNKAYADVQY